MLETELCAGSGNEATVDNGEKSTGLRKEVTRLSSMPQIGQQSGGRSSKSWLSKNIR